MTEWIVYDAAGNELGTVVANHVDAARELANAQYPDAHHLEPAE